MAAVMDATIEQVATLGALTEMLVDVDRTISTLLAARDGILALGSQWAMEVAEQAQHPDFGDMTTRSVAAEFGAALRVTDRTVQRRMADAEWFVTRFPRVWAAQAAGSLSAGHARVIVDAAEHLDDAADREAYSEQMIAFAQSESPNRVARMARRVAERFQPRSLDERHHDAREQRRVWVSDLHDGMAQLGMIGPAALVHGVFDRLTGMAKTVQAEPGGEVDRSADQHTIDQRTFDQRTIDQLRADLALDLLLSGAPAGHEATDAGPGTSGADTLGAVRAQVSVTIPMMTLLGHDGAPAELDGCRPIDGETARALAGAASGWDRVLTHPITGAVLAVDRYRPSAELRRHLRARDQRCRFPGCGRSPNDSDIDHTQDAALGGETREENLAHLCRRHHSLKHHSAWHVERLDAGLFAWTSPTGKTYIDRPQPPSTVMFHESSEQAPF